MLAGGNRTLFLCFFLALVQASCAFSIFYGNYEGVWRGWFWGVLGGVGHVTVRAGVLHLTFLHCMIYGLFATLCCSLLCIDFSSLHEIQTRCYALQRSAMLCYALTFLRCYKGLAKKFGLKKIRRGPRPILKAHTVLKATGKQLHKDMMRPNPLMWRTNQEHQNMRFFATSKMNYT